MPTDLLFLLLFIDAMIFALSFIFALSNDFGNGEGNKFRGPIAFACYFLLAECTIIILGVGCELLIPSDVTLRLNMFKIGLEEAIAGNFMGVTAIAINGYSGNWIRIEKKKKPKKKRFPSPDIVGFVDGPEKSAKEIKLVQDIETRIAEMKEAN